jgi:hypothetical protein
MGYRFHESTPDLLLAFFFADFADSTRVSPISSAQRELAKLMTDHILIYVDRDELVAVMYGKSMTNKLRRNRRPPRPGFDHPPVTASIHFGDLLEQLAVDVGTFFQTSSHSCPTYFFFGLRLMIALSLGFFFLRVL